jgi:arylsulfatase A-like enzyme
VAALRQADAAFGRLLEAARRLYQAVNIIVTSDHGYVTVSGRFDVAAALRDGGFLPDGDTPAAIICGDGGAVSLYLGGEVDSGRLARHLLASPWVSAAFSPGGRIAGTLPLEAAGGGERPDLMLSLAWDGAVNAHGVPGSGWTSSTIAPGSGDHGGLSAWEMHNTLVLAGPAFREGVVSETPCGIVDIAPTVLAQRGLTPPPEWQGRVLAEVLRDGGTPPEGVTGRLIADGPAGEQMLRLARAGSVSYPCSAGPRTE